MLDGGQRADDLLEILAGEDRHRHQHEHEQRGERCDDAEPPPRRGHDGAQGECERGERQEHHDGVHDERMQGEPCDVWQVHTRNTRVARRRFS